METKEQFYRLELSFDGEPQEVGIFVGIRELGFLEETEESLLRDFEQNLPLPISAQRGTFWFREEGLRRFQPALDVLISEVRKKGWEVVLYTAKMEMDAVLYQDIYQVAFSEDSAHTSQNGVSAFSSVKELLEDITYASAEKKALDIIEHAFRLAGYAVNPPMENCITIRDKAVGLNFRLLIESTTESVDET